MDEQSIYEELARGPKDVPFGYFRDLLAHIRALSAALAQAEARAAKAETMVDLLCTEPERSWVERLAQAEAEREALRTACRTAIVALQDSEDGDLYALTVEAEDGATQILRDALAWRTRARAALGECPTPVEPETCPHFCEPSECGTCAELAAFREAAFREGAEALMERIVDRIWNHEWRDTDELVRDIRALPLPEVK